MGEWLLLLGGGLCVSIVVAVLLGRLLRRRNAQYHPVARPAQSRVPEWLRVGGGRNDRP